MTRVASIAALLAALAVTGSASAYCPSYTLSSSNNSYNCGVEAVPGTNPSVAAWQGLFTTVAQGPPAWGNDGPAVADIGQGCGKPEPNTKVPAKFACELLKAIAMAESGWTQFCVPTTPADQVGGASRTIISFDCGYGIAQVTSGMHIGENPSYNPQRVAAEPLYNLATGASILAAKWRATQCVGDNQPTVVEHWYTAVWAYNGLAYSNNPSNPNYSSTRGVWNPTVGGAAPYQEKVFGRVEHPSGDPPRWESVALAYPNPADVGGTGAPPALPEPSCASPTNCTSKRSVHTSNCFGGPIEPGTGGVAGHAGAAGSAAGGGVNAGGGGAAGWTSAGGTGAGATGAASGKNQSSSTLSDEGGCQCAAAGRTSSRGSAWLLALLGLSLLGRRRARR